jgi:hypothetical protein
MVLGLGSNLIKINIDPEVTLEDKHYKTGS